MTSIVLGKDNQWHEHETGLPLLNRNVDVIAWDLDSSMFNTSQRHWMIPEIRAKHKTWEDYSMACEYDEPFPAAVALCCMFAPHARQVAISGRKECALDLTWASVRRHGIPLDDIMLSPPRIAGDKFKVDGIRKLKKDGYLVRLFVEDDPRVAEVIREMTGVPVLVVNPCYPERAF